MSLSTRQNGSNVSCVLLFRLYFFILDLKLISCILSREDYHLLILTPLPSPTPPPPPPPPPPTPRCYHRHHHHLKVIAVGVHCESWLFIVLLQSSQIKRTVKIPLMNLLFQR